METFTILPKRDANYKIPILFLTGLIWDLNLSSMKKYLTSKFFKNNFFKLKKVSTHKPRCMHACIYIYIYEFRASFEAFVAKDDNPYCSYDQTLFGPWLNCNSILSWRLISYFNSILQKMILLAHIDEIAKATSYIITYGTF